MRPGREPLTLAEGAVLDLLCDGKGPNEIARLRGVSPGTVKGQISTIRAKRSAGSVLKLVTDEWKTRAGR